MYQAPGSSNTPSPITRTLLLSLIATIAIALVACGNSTNRAAAPAKSVLSSATHTPKGTTHTIALSGTNEVPPTGLPGQGTATVTLDPYKGEICYKITVSGIKLPATAAHIHKGAVGTDGPIVVHLIPPGTNGMSSGCATAEAAVINDIVQHPADYYLNVHNADRPNGVLRGQFK